MISYEPVINPIAYKGCNISVLRLDLLHADVSGNKWFKLKHNLEQAKLLNKHTIVTFGGAYSNHIIATAAACKEAGINSVGIIRGEEESKNNPTLSKAMHYGMRLQFVNREDYKKKEDESFLHEIERQYPNSYIIPEGGSNALGEKGCAEILTNNMSVFNTIFCAVGTGTTFNGIATSLVPTQKLVGVNVLKYEAISNQPQAEILNQYHFGGYAKHTTALLGFKDWFENTYSIPLDYVYTAKLFYALFNQIDEQKIEPKNSVLIVHTGGLQGNAGYEQRYNLNPKRQVNEPQG
jgi:1-aminocyclopropane-1-carboxylate deaminase